MNLDSQSSGRSEDNYLFLSKRITVMARLKRRRGVAADLIGLSWLRRITRNESGTLCVIVF